MHLTTALLAHLLSYDMTWGATKKEVERSNFFIEVPRILRRFWLALGLACATLATVAVLALDVVPLGWRIPGAYWAVILPLA